MKEKYIEEINELIEKCNDELVLEIILQMLQKAI